MNKQAEAGLGAFLMIFIGAIVGLTLFLTVAQTAGPITATIDLANGTTTVGANGARVDLTGQDLIGTAVVYNGTDLVGSGNYTIDEIVSTSTGVKTISYLVDDAAYASIPLNISYTYGADGYVDSSGGRAMVNLIAIFFALAVAAIVIGPVVKEGMNLGN